MLYAEVISFFVTRKCQKIQKSSDLLNDLRNFKEFFRRFLTYNNIKSDKKPRLHHLSRRYIVGKMTEEREGG